MDDFVDAAASYPTLSQQLQHDEKVYAMLKSRGYECSSVLIRKRYCALYRGKRTSNGAGVLLKTYESKLRMQRSREFLNLLAGTGTAPEILEYVEDDSFMVFSDLGGVTGESLLEEDASPNLRQDTSGFIQLAITLAHSLNILHSRRVIHGSISPANFMYVPDGASGGYRAILLEFHGALKFDEENSETHAIWQRQPLAYISPEQTGQVAMRTDYRCDLYSLGVVLYQLCAGRLPCGEEHTTEAYHTNRGPSVYSAQDDSGAVVQQLHDVLFHTPRLASEVNANVPHQISAILARLLMKQPDMRYQSAFGLAADLARCLTEWRASESVASFPLCETDPPMTFHISQTSLFGRDEELRTLRQRCARARTSRRPQCVLLEGAAGVGKSALMNSVAVPSDNFLCLSGKFEENKQQIPYGAFAQAMSHLVRKVLVLPPEEASQLRDALRQGQRSNSVSLLVNAFPDIEKIFGQLPREPEMENPMRFVEVITWFLQTIASPSKPLVLLVDDMQWADPSSLRLLQALLTAEIRSLVVIGAYRPGNSAVSNFVEVLKSEGVDHTVMALAPLNVTTIAELMQSCLRMEKEVASRLSAILLKKTLGYPFFLIHYFKLLYDTNVLRFDHTRGYWTCNVDQVAGMELAENAAELMIATFKRLDPKTLLPLLYASCFGGEFSSALLAAAVGTTESELRSVLEQFAEHSFIYEVCSGVYKFCHDHVRSVAYASLSVEERERLHLKLARAMLRMFSTDELAQNLFDVVGHFSRASLAGFSADDLRQLVSMYESASEKALKASAYPTAATFALDGLRVLSKLSPDHWATDQTLSATLTLTAVKCLNWSGDRAKATILFEELIAKATSLAQKVEAYVSILHFHLVDSLMSEEILRIAPRFCDLVGIKFPDLTCTEADARASLREAFEALDRVGIDNVATMQEDPEPFQQTCISVLMPSMFSLSPAIAVALSALAIRRVAVAGVCDHLPVCILFATRFGIRNDLISNERAQQLGDVALRITERFPRATSRPLASMMYAIAVQIVRHHPLSCLSYIPSVNADVSSFSYWYTAVIARNRAELHAIGDQNLEDALHEVRKCARVVQHPYHHAEDMHLMVTMMSMFLSELQVGAAALVGPTQFPSKQWRDLEEKTRSRKAPQPLLLIIGLKSSLFYLLGRSEEAVAFGRVLYTQRPKSFGNYPVFLCLPTFILALLDVIHKSNSEEAKEEREALDRAMRGFEEECKMITGATAGLLKLVQARATEVLQRDLVKAAGMYEEAIVALRADRLPLMTGVCLTLAGANANALRMRTAAAHFFEDACKAYAAYGATTMVATVVREHGARHQSAMSSEVRNMSAVGATLSRTSPREDRERAAVASATSTPFSPLNAQLDAYTVLQMTTVMSRHFELRTLLDEVTRILVTNTGADFACICNSTALPSIEIIAQRRNGSDPAKLPPVTGENLDRNTAEIIRYVGTFHEPILLDNAFADARFTPPSARDYSTGVKSVLCLSMRASGCTSVIYLENHSMAGAFTEARMALVEAIIPQFSIGIERARLIQALKDASEELGRKNERLERADTHKDQFLAVTTHELRTPLHGIISATSLLIDSSPLTEEQREYASVVLSASKSLLTLVEDILDLTRIRASKLRIELRAFSLVPLVETVLEVLSGAAGEKGIDLAYEIDASGAGTAAADVVRTRQLTSDPLRIQQVIMNLLSNAIKFTPRGYVLLTVSLHGSGPGAQLRLSVKDTGVGIAAEKMPRLFQMFSQLDTPDPSRYDGYGVGLFICHSVVQLLGGTITAESDGRSGSTFVVTVPISVAATPAEDAESDAKSAPVVTKYSSPTRCLVWATHAHTMRIVTAELTRVGLASEVCDSAAAYSRALATYGATACAVVDLAYAHEVVRMHDEMGKRPGGIVVLCSYVEWRRWERKEGFTPLFKPLQPRRIPAMVRSAFSSVPLPKDLKAPLVFSEVSVTRNAPPSLLGSTAHRHQGPASLPRTLSADTARLAANTPPLTSVACSTSPASGAPLTSSPSLRYVLVVEDNVLNAKMLCKMLGTLYTVDTANNGLEAVESVKKRSPDLVLMDIQMPVMDGVAASQELRRLGFRMPIIAATASLSTSERELAFSAGMNDVLAKPFTKQGVLTLVRRHLFTAGSAKSGGPA